MNTQSNQSFIFGSEIRTPVQWRSHLTSVVVHIIAVVILLLIPLAITHEADQRIRTTTILIAPQLKPYKPEAPKIRAPKLLAKSVVIPKPLLSPPHPEVKPPVPAPVIANIPKPVIQPQIAAVQPKPLPRVVVPEVAPAPAIKPQVHTGLFGSEEAARKVEVPKDLKVGGFGDPNGAQVSPESKSTLVAKVGSFEMPQGEGANGGSGGMGRGVIRQTSFGSAEGAGSGPGGKGMGSGHGVIHQAGFGEVDGAG
jgi:hypothetical protein